MLITGGTAGLGKLTAKKLGEAGYLVTILGHDAGRTKDAAKELGCAYVLADVSDQAMVKKALADATKANGQIDILINNAGIWIQGDLENNNLEEVHKTIEINGIGAIYCTHAAVKKMKSKKSGRIIFISSIRAQHPIPQRSAYVASKWTMTGFAKAMQEELRPFKIGVSIIYPGAMKDTNIFSHDKNHRDMTDALDPEIVADTIVNICNLPDSVSVPEFGIESLSY